MDKPAGSSHLNFTLAGLLAVGGVAGFMKAKSVPSLVAGLGCSAAYAGSGVLINQGESAKGHAVAIVPSALLMGAMGFRAVKSGFKPMPTGVAILGTLASLYNAQKYKEWSE